MTNRSRAKGTQWETAIVAFLRDHGWPYAERRALSGNLDRGDIAGLPAVVVEAKNAKTINLAGWLDEATVERDNDHADLGAVWIKRRGRLDPGRAYVVVDGDTFVQLLKAAGY